jgi:UDP-3-O-[3-hydroxymyristoyl] glucosamine N-acyltransferase
VKQYTLAEIADFLEIDLHGDPECVVSSIAGLEKAGDDQISFFAKVPGFVSCSDEHLTNTKAAAVILAPKDTEKYSGNALLAENPYASYAKLTGLFNDAEKPESGIHKSAIIGQNCAIHDSATIAANVTIGNNVSIGENTIIAAGVVIGDNVKIGNNSHLYPNVTVYYNVQICNRVLIHSGAVIGADGFGMANDNGKWCKIHQLGGVFIANDVEIGANTCIDRGALEDTVIEEGVKLDNQIQVGHNVKIGAHTVIAGCTGIAGSTTIGRYCMIGGAVNFNGHINITDEVIITGTSTVGKSINESGIYSSGFGAEPYRKWLKIRSIVSQLGDLANKLRKLEDKL